MANELIVTNAAALAALVDKTTGETLTAAEYTTLKDSLQEANTATRAANVVFSGPASGAVAAPTFRALVVADIPSLTAYAAAVHVHSAADLTSGTLPDARFPAALPALNGSALTSLNATNLASGTVPDARFPATLPALNGSALTSLNASSLASGTIPDARFPAVLPAISGANLTNLPPGGSVFATQVQIPDGSLAAPSLSFGSTTEGWFRRSGGILSYVYGSLVHAELFGGIIQLNATGGGGVKVCDGSPHETPADTGWMRDAAATWKATDGGGGFGHIRVGTLAVNNSAAATTLGTVTDKIEIFDGAGASLGFIAVYDAIT